MKNSIWGILKLKEQIKIIPAKISNKLAILLVKINAPFKNNTITKNHTIAEGIASPNEIANSTNAASKSNPPRTFNNISFL